MQQQTSEAVSSRQVSRRDSAGARAGTGGHAVQRRASDFEGMDFASQEAAFAPGGTLDASTKPDGAQDTSSGPDAEASTKPSDKELGAATDRTMGEMNNGRWGIGYRQGDANSAGKGALAFFEQPQEGSTRFTWKLWQGRSASEALRAWLIGPTVCECRTAVVAAQLKAILDVCGDDAFDAMFGSETAMGQYGRLVISDDRSTSSLQHVTTQTIAGAKNAHGKAEGRTDLEIGALYYFGNHPGYLCKHPDGLWKGENVIYSGPHPETGEPLWTGFGATTRTEKQMLEELLREYNRDREPGDYQWIVQRFGLQGKGAAQFVYGTQFTKMMNQKVAVEGREPLLGNDYIFDADIQDTWQSVADAAQEAGKTPPRAPVVPTTVRSKYPWKLGSIDEIVAAGGGFDARHGWKIDAAKLRKGKG